MTPYRLRSTNLPRALPCPCPSLAGWNLGPLLLREKLRTTRSSSCCGLCSLSREAAPLFPAAASLEYFTICNYNCGIFFPFFGVLFCFVFFPWPLKRPFRRWCSHTPSPFPGSHLGRLPTHIARLLVTCSSFHFH